MVSVKHVVLANPIGKEPTKVLVVGEHIESKSNEIQVVSRRFLSGRGIQD